ncbi:MAG: protease inhibitor I42 family protein [bacterium]
MKTNTIKTNIFFLLALINLVCCSDKEVINNPDFIKTEYEITVNGSFQINLVSNPTTGYSWQWTNKQSISIVDTFNHGYIPKQPMLVGSGGKEIWRFKGIKTGTDTIKLEYCRSWDPNSTVETKNISVIVK